MEKKTFKYFIGRSSLTNETVLLLGAQMWCYVIFHADWVLISTESVLIL